MGILAPKLKGVIYQLAVDTYTDTMTTQEFNVATATSTFGFDFNGIRLNQEKSIKLKYMIVFVMTSNTLIGPVDAEISVIAGDITVTDQECIGTNDELLALQTQ